MLLALLAAYLSARTLPRAWRTLNTDFPNYYLTAQLTREHYDTLASMNGYGYNVRKITAT